MGTDPLAALALHQDGVVSRAQALASGLSVRQVVWRVSSGRWVRLYPGVFLTQPGRDDRRSANSAAVLACGSGAVLSHWSVAHGLGLTRAVPKLVHVSVPLTRRVVEPPGVVVHRRCGGHRRAGLSARGDVARGAWCRA